MGGVGCIYGTSKARPVLGFCLGFLLGLIGIAILAIIPARRTTPVTYQQRQKARILCPWCLERNPANARMCDHCLRPLVQPSMSMTRR
jgi:hypothetical protein